MIEDYKFGSITINGKNYTNDVYITLSGEVKSWRRRESHIIDIKDVKEAVEERPEIIILGTGAYGIAEVREEAKKYIKDKGIDLYIKNSHEAKEDYNNLSREKKVVALFHLTC